MHAPEAPEFRGYLPLQEVSHLNMAEDRRDEPIEIELFAEEISVEEMAPTESLAGTMACVGTSASFACVGGTASSFSTSSTFSSVSVAAVN